MSRSRKIFELIQPRATGTVVCGNYLIIKPSVYVARGFFLDTTPHKNQMKLFRVVMPLYRPGEYFSLNYSNTISGEHAGLFLVDRKAYAESASIVLDKINPHIEPLRNLHGPREFLGYISWMASNRMMPVRLNFGLTHYLLGNLQQATDIFRGMERDLADYKPQRQDRYRSVITQVLDLLENDPAALQPLLDTWRDEQIEKLGLSASVVPPRLRLVP